MRLTALENTPVDFTASVTDDFLHSLGLTKGQFNSISPEQAAYLQKTISLAVSPGGSAANVCHGFANLGLEAAFIGSIGNDENGRYYADELSRAGVIPYLKEKRGATGRCMTLITDDKERTFAMNMGKSSSLKPWDFEAWPIAISGIFHTTAYALDSMYWAVKRAMAIAKRNNVKISFDLASVTSIRRHRGKINHLLEKYVDIVFANEEEAGELTGEKNPLDALKLLDRQRIAAVKIGKHGALVGKPHNHMPFTGKCLKNMEAAVPPYSVSSVKNTNGAGDAFAAGFLYGISKGYNLYKSGRIGNFYASRVVQVEPARLPYKIGNIEDLL